jgi:uncharacterized surface protein with fasciclin (FAS1) repeats
VLSLQYSCKKNSAIDPGFKDMEKFTIYDYLIANEKDFSSFIQILQVGGLDKTLSAYNPNGIDYTLFAPDNKAVDNFIKESGQYATLADLLKDKPYTEALARYHVINKGTTTNEFPFGTFSEPTLSKDYLNVNFDVRPDTTYYKINNQARVIKANIEVSNGYIQVIGTMLKPITLNSYAWLKKNSAYSILTAAIEATGMDKIINVDMKLKDQPLQPFTMLVEPDAIFKKQNINSLADLIKVISPDRTDYTNTGNPLNLFVGYHILTESKFLDDMEGRSTNYNTFADIPMTINGMGLDIVINRGKEIFISATKDTTDFVGIYYDESNVNTQSGAIHFITQILKPQIPTRSIITDEFWDEWGLSEYRNLYGTFSIDNLALLHNVSWSGAKLSYVRSNSQPEVSWSNDYMLIQGDFTITYNIPKIIQGKYNVFLQADAYSSQNAVIEVYVDGVKLGGLIDLTKGGSASWPFYQFKVGAIDFKKYAGHAIQVKSLIPGRFMWDYIRFEPI